MKTGLRFFCPLLLLCVSAAVRGQAPEAPFLDQAPQSVVEDSSPATFGMAVVPGSDGRLMVTRVAPGSVAETAGFRTGDIIVSLDGHFLTEATELQEFLAARPATPLSIAIHRDGAAETIVINPVTEVPEATTVRRPDLESTARPALGVRFIAGDQVVLAETLVDSPAATAGLQAGDQIIAVNEAVVTSSNQFITLVAAADIHDTLTITYLRGSDRLVATVSPAAWDVVFAAPQQHVAWKPDGTTVVAPTTVGTAPVYPGYYVSNMSPVGVPSIAFPYYSYAAYGYGPAWYYPYTYYSGYYPNYYVYYPNWYYPWGYPAYWGGPYPGRPNRPTHHDTDSASMKRIDGLDREVTAK